MLNYYQEEAKKIMNLSLPAETVKNEEKQVKKKKNRKKKKKQAIEDEEEKMSDNGTIEIEESP